MCVCVCVRAGLAPGVEPHPWLLRNASVGNHIALLFWPLACAHFLSSASPVLELDFIITSERCQNIITMSKSRNSGHHWNRHPHIYYNRNRKDAR